MKEEDICFSSISELAPMLQRKELSPVEVTEAVLRRITALGPRLNAFISLSAATALEAALVAEQEITDGHYRGALHGIPLALKDLFYTKGVATTAGSKILAGFIPEHDATVVTRLLAQGAVIVGKNNMHEFAFGADNLNPHYRPAVNPWNAARITGGSSGGSAAAVAAGLCLGAYGSDTGGSIRIPAACCGVVGLKPTYGRISRFGVVPLSWTQDTIGQLARSALDAAILFEAVAGHDQQDSSCSRRPVERISSSLDGDARGLRVGIPRSYFFDGLEPEVRRLAEEAITDLARIGVEIIPIEMGQMTEAASAATIILFAEAASYHRGWLRQRAQDYGDDVRTRLQTGSLLLATDYLNAQRTRKTLGHQAAVVFRQVDAIVTPGLPMVAPARDATTVTLEDRVENTRTALTRLTRPFNLLGWPAITIPCGLSADGLPVGLQLAGKPFDERTILRLADAYERSTERHKRKPKV